MFSSPSETNQFHNRLEFARVPRRATNRITVIMLTNGGDTNRIAINE